MNDNISIKSLVDSSLIDKVEQECYQILLQQRLLYNERWYSSMLFTKSTSLLRLIGVLVSSLGVLVCVFYLVYPSSCPKWFFAELYLLFFIATGWLFYFLPRIEIRIITRLKNAGGKSCKNMARRLIAKAKKLVPYDAEYTIKGDLITYYRGKNNNWQQVWSRRLKGFAIVSKHAILLFRKPTSIQPTMLILYENNEIMESVLKELGVSYKTLP
ncbi:MAG TPA: hypothetical protein VIM41_01240 [Gammaproteobacteria bacterium]